MSIKLPVDFAAKHQQLFGSTMTKTPRIRHGSDDEKEPKENDVGASQATKATELVVEAAEELWHDAMRIPFATLHDPVTGVVSHYPIHGRGLTELVNFLYFERYARTISSESIKSAVNTIAAMAKYNGTQHASYSRTAHYEGSIFVDVGDDRWHAIRIDPASWDAESASWRSCWSVVPSRNVPVRFRRSPSSRALPLPVQGGSLNLIRQLFPNIANDEWMLLVGWLIGAFQRTGGRAHLELQGTNGSGKSSLQRLLVSILDPTEIPSRSVPRDEQAVMIGVQGKAMLAFDNVSALTPEMADVWCRLSTGGGLGQRKLHTDQDEVLLRAQLPISWTASAPIAAGRPDLQDRTISLRLEQLDSETYRSEEELEAVELATLPSILGALYDALSVALARVGTLSLERLPRLADFARWVESATPALGWDDGSFISVLESSRDLASTIVVDASPIGPPIVAFMNDRRHWDGSSSELLDQVRHLVKEDTRRARSFPNNPTQFSMELRRLVQPLMAVGIRVEFNRSAQRRNIILEHRGAPRGQDRVNSK